MKLFKKYKTLSNTKSVFFITPNYKNLLTNNNNEKEKDHSGSDIRNEDYTPKRTAEGRSYGTSADTFLKGVRHKKSGKTEIEDLDLDTYQDVRGRGSVIPPGGQGSNQSDSAEANKVCKKDKESDSKNPGGAK